MLRGALCSSSLVREASPARRYYADLGCQGTRRLLQQQILVAPSTASIMFLRQKPAAATWLVARNVSQRAKTDVWPMRLCSLCIYCGEDAPPIHLADRRCAPSAFIASCPLHWQAAPGPSCSRRTCPIHCQTVRPCRTTHCAHHPLYEKLPLHAEATQILGVRAQEDCSSSKHK